MMTREQEKEGEPERKDLMDSVGGNGPWQWWTLSIFFACNIPSGGNNLAMTFFAPNLDHWCSRPPRTNLSVEEWKEIALPAGDSLCSRYKYINISLSSEGESLNKSLSNETIACDSWEFDDSFYTSTIVSQWNLVCDREWLISLSKSVFVIGYMISASLFAYFADRFGRRPVIVMSNALAVVGGICTVVSPSFPVFAVSRVVAATGVTGAAETASVLMVELVGPRHRSLYFAVFMFAWSVGVLQLPLVAWWLRDWLWMEAVLLVPSFLLLFSWWSVPESPRWLAHGRPDEAVRVLAKAAERNGVRVSNAQLKEMVSEIGKSGEDETSRASLTQLFHPDLRGRTLIVWFLWSGAAFVYYGISYNTNELTGDALANFALSNLVEVPATLLALAAVERGGRRRLLALAFGGAAIACPLASLIPQDPWWMRTCVSMFGKFFSAANFFIVNLFSFELFPTLLRNIGVGSASTVARFAVFLAPFVRELERASHPVVPQIVFGIVSAVSAGLALLLPETTDCSVPDSIRAAADISKQTNTENRPV